MRITTTIPVGLAAALLAFTSLASAQTSYRQYAIVSDASSPLVTGGGTSASADSTLAWYDSSTLTTSSFLGGGASLAVGCVTELLGVSTPTSLARFNIGGGALGTDATAYWSIDLGSDLLVSDTAEHDVISSQLRITDFGTQSDPDQYYDFTIGLWNGSDLIYADSLSDLSFVDDSPAANNFIIGDITVEYLGNHVFRAREHAADSGSTLLLISAVDGYHARTLTVSAGDVSLGNVTGDLVSLTAFRTLSPIPEPSGALLLGLTGTLALLHRRRSSQR